MLDNTKIIKLKKDKHIHEDISIKKTNYIVVFDLDETLGHFVQMGIFWDTLNAYHGKNLSNEHFFFTLNLFNQFLRPKILKILKYLKDKKIANNCDKIMIYTNNQGPKEWTNLIKSYFHYKLNYPLFDQVIGAFKIHGKLIESNRTSHDKSVKDLIRCTHLPENTQICFLDDQYHPKMKNDNVLYINIKPYVYTIPFDEMAATYYDAFYNHKTNINNKPTKDIFINYVLNYTKDYRFTILKKSTIEQQVDDILSKKIFMYIKEFFEKRNNKNSKYTL
jgi:hypothetical protein